MRVTRWYDFEALVPISLVFARLAPICSAFADKTTLGILSAMKSDVEPKGPDIVPSSRGPFATEFKRRRLITAALVVAVVLGLLVFFFPSQRPPGQARQGLIDASSLGATALSLAGEWEVLEDSQNPSARGSFAVLPAPWARPYGYASYRLRIRGLDPGRSYAVATSYIDTSYRLWANDTLLLSGGIPGRSEAETQAAYHSGLARLPGSVSEVELWLEVANFVHLRGGLYRGILLGDADYLQRYDSWSFISELVIIGILVFIAGIAFISAALRRSPSSLWYGLLCLTGAAGLSFLAPDLPAFRIFPSLSWDAYVRLTFSIVYLAPLFLFLVSQSLFGGLSTRRTVTFSLPPVILSVLALLLPLKVFTSANLVYVFDSLLLMALAATLFGRAVARAYPYARLFSLGFATFLSTILGALLFSNDRIDRGGLSALSFLYPLFGAGLSDSFVLDIVSYLLAFAGLNAFSVLFLLDAPKIEGPLPPLADSTGLKRSEVQFEALGLSPREIEVVLLALEGKRNKEIAETLFVSENTIKTHLARIFAKTGVKARSELFALFLR